MGDSGEGRVQTKDEDMVELISSWLQPFRMRVWTEPATGSRAVMRSGSAASLTQL